MRTVCACRAAAAAAAAQGCSAASAAPTTSSLTRRIVILNLAALVALVGGILYLNQFRAGLIDTRVESLLTQGQIIAAAIAAQASVDTDAITIDPDKLLELQAGQSGSPYSVGEGAADFPINPERVAPLLRRLISPTRTRARIYDPDGALHPRFARPLHARPDPELRPAAARPRQGPIERWWDAVKLWYRSGELPVYEEIGSANGREYSGGRLGAERRGGERRARRRGRRPHRLRRGAGAALPRRARQPAALHRIGRHRRHRAGRAAGHHARLPGRGGGDGAALDAARQHHRRPGAPARRGRRARAPRRQAPARGDPRFRRPQGRDRPSGARALRHDQRALQAHGGDRELCRRRRARAEEPADVAPQRGRDAADRPHRRAARAPARRHQARRAAARPADHRHLRRLAPRRRACPRGDRAGRPRASCWRPSSSIARETRVAEQAEDPARRSSTAAAARTPSTCSATTAASARSSTT